MGVRGLLSHIKHAGMQCSELVDLVKVCKNKPVEIIVDFKAVRSELYQDLTRFLTSEYDNKYLSLPGGEYEAMAVYLRNYFQQLKEMGLKLTFVMDFLYPSHDEDPHEIKHHQWKSKRVDQLQTNEFLEQDMESGSSNFFQNSAVRIPLPVFFAEIFCDVTQSMEFEFIYPFGNETDFYRAKLVRERQAFAVLTNDTEYVLFQDIPVIVWQLFDLDKKLAFKLENGSSSVQSLTCFVIKSSGLQRNLNLATHNQLVDMTSLAGNLFTRPHVESNELTNALRLSRNFYKIAEFVKQNSALGHLEDSGRVRGVISRHRMCHQIREGFANARKYFTLEEDPSQRPFNASQDPIIQFLITPSSVKEYDSMALEIAMGASWLAMPLQDLKIPCVSDKLLPIHQRLAGFLHKCDKKSIIHMFIRPDFRTRELSSLPVPPIASGDGTTIEEVVEEDVEKNMKRFVEIITYYRMKNDSDTLDDEMEELLNNDNFEMALCIYTFRLLRHINPSANYFTEDAIVDLATSTLALRHDKYRQQIPITLMEEIYRTKYPVTMKHLTIFNWYQEIMWIATYLCRFLRLTELIHLKKLMRSLSLQLFVACQYITRGKRAGGTWKKCESVESRLSPLFKTIKQENESFFKLIMK